MKTNSEIQNELESLSSFLSAVDKKEETRRAMPAGYFDHLPERVLHQIYELEGLKSKKPISKSLWEKYKIVIGQWWSMQYIVPAAACLIVVLWSSYFNNYSERASNALSGMDKNEVIQYLEMHSDEIDENLLANLQPSFKEIAAGQEEEHIILYLDENNGYDAIEEI